MLTVDQLKSVLSYSPETGQFTWLISPSNSVPVGSKAGSIQNTGYWAVSLWNRKYLCHRLAFLYMEGSWPNSQVDHINSIRSDNRWCNLRHATNSQNGFNKRAIRSSTGIKNVYKNGRGYLVRLTINGVDKCLGTYSDSELAELVAEEARSKYQGEYKSNH